MQEAAEKSGEKINIQKTKVVHINTENTQNFSIYGIDIEEVQSFCYLSSVISVSGGSSAAIGNRMEKAVMPFGSLQAVRNASHISRCTKRRIFNSLRGLHFMVVKRGNEVSSLQVFVSRWLRKSENEAGSNMFYAEEMVT